MSGVCIQPPIASDSDAEQDWTQTGVPVGLCHVCQIDALWRLKRRGDAITDWACFTHLSDVCWNLQRDFEKTEIVVTWWTR